VLSVVGDAIRRVADKSRVVIRVNLNDVDRVSGYRERLTSLVGGIGQIEIRPDPSISQGGCIVETSVEIIDARFEEQLSRLEEVLIGNE
ncbi:MAG: flagellar assembly protein FliH, partial [Candidatus Latescibacteria bacterium]|nr:flagellar assembly protein FliH [Candidatus Latescibacterota bacterium]